MVDIDKLEALEKAATPGGWGVVPTPEGTFGKDWRTILALDARRPVVVHGEYSTNRYGEPETVAGVQISEANADFITEARNAFPELVREVRELRGIAEAARELADEGCSDCGYIPPRLWTALAEYDAGGAK